MKKHKLHLKELGEEAHIILNEPMNFVNYNTGEIIESVPEQNTDE